MRAIILAGGVGTRLRPLTYHIPKPMIPIIDKPLLEYTVSLLRSHGVVDIAMALGYKAEYIVDYFGDGSDFGVHIEYFCEDVPLGTAGAVKRAEEYLSEDFLVLSGDALTNIDITALVKRHLSCRGLVTMAVTKVKNATGLGLVHCNREGKITSFLEKPKHAVEGLVNTGIYAMNRAVLNSIQEDKMCDFSYDVFPHILSYMYAYFCNSYWSDIGTLSAYYEANSFVVDSPELFGITL